MSKLKVEMLSDREVRVTREFKAPVQLVWDAHTKPELMRVWQRGYDGWSMTICEMDVRAGGAYRWRWRNDQDGTEMGFHGRFLDVTDLKNLVDEQCYEPGDIAGPMTSEPIINTTTFEQIRGRTILTVTMLFASREARDGAVASGMTDGIEFNYQRIDEMALT
jgi:uncharacterized protein YndB with AHSA1/START domain